MAGVPFHALWAVYPPCSNRGYHIACPAAAQICAARKSNAATLLDTKGPEIRTAMLRDHKPISLEAGQPIIVQAVGAKYAEFEGYKEEGGETRIGLSYDKLCQSVKPGNMILLADGSISIRVDDIMGEKELRGTVLNSKSLGERKNCNLPGVKVEIPVLTEKDINDLQNFAAKHKMDFVAASFVQVRDWPLFPQRAILNMAVRIHVGLYAKALGQATCKCALDNLCTDCFCFVLVQQPYWRMRKLPTVQVLHNCA